MTLKEMGDTVHQNVCIEQDFCSILGQEVKKESLHNFA